MSGGLEDLMKVVVLGPVPCHVCGKRVIWNGLRWLTAKRRLRHEHPHAWQDKAAA